MGTELIKVQAVQNPKNSHAVNLNPVYKNQVTSIQMIESDVVSEFSSLLTILPS